MPFDLIIRGGTVVLPQTDGVAADIGISSEKIAAVLAPGTVVEASETLDAAGKVVLPGVIDVHLQLGHGKDIARPRVPEDAATETAAAAVVIAPAHIRAVEIDDGEVGVEADGDAALAVVKPHRVGGRAGEQRGDAPERQPAFVMRVGEHTLVRGRFVLRDGALVDGAVGTGRYVSRAL